MTIACLGWGSLIWNPGDLPVDGNWFEDGPFLPIEYSRQSKDGRLTLVVVADSALVPVLWCKINLETLVAAKVALQARENIPDKYLEKSIGYITSDTICQTSVYQTIKDWAANHSVDAVIWTNLKPKFKNENRAPTVTEAITYLKSLPNETKQIAEEYIRRTPKQIRTEFRKRIEKELGWTSAD